MEAYEFGKNNAKKILLIPGNMMCWKQFKDVIPLLEKNYHVIAISTDGYDGKGTTFTTALSSAEIVEDYIKDNLEGHINLVFGESFGSATAAELFNRQRVRIDSLILSGPQYMRMGALTGILERVIPKNQYKLVKNIAAAKKAGKMPLMLKLYTRASDETLFEEFNGLAENISLETLKNCTSEGLKLYSEIERFEIRPEAHVSIWYGEKEPNMKKALKILTRIYPNAEVHPFPGMGHGEIIGHPDIMAHAINEFINNHASCAIKTAPSKT
ncbi:MAG: alpha/beta hydrolase [Eubacteriales bacterium]|nr:alpha/beta hydrolase [Eubacteriales bacterium]